MQTVMDVRDARQAAVGEHPFFEWLRAATVPLDRRLDFAPGAALFIMQFRDMNLWAHRFAEPRNEFEWVINAGTIEDCTHSGLFLKDWRRLGLDEKLGWRASDMLWWLFVSPDQERMRHCGMRYLSMAVADGDDPLARFAHSEAGEATGHVFLSHTAPIAIELSEATGKEYPYFGPEHLARESGHVGNTEGVFEELTLSDEQRENAVGLCSEMFDVFDDIFTAFLAYGQNYVDAGVVPSRPARVERRTGVAPARIDLSSLHGDPRHVRMAARLEARRAQAAAHPFYAWLDEENGISPREKLCRFVPMWTMDVLGYRDLVKYALSYPDPTSEAERAINGWAAELSTHSEMFLEDWDALGLDDQLGFEASGALEFVFLDPDMDSHREHLVAFAKLAMRHQHPALRWWMMSALEATGETFFAHTRPLAEAVERETGTRLDYLAERHSLDVDASQVRPPLPPAPLEPGDADTAIGLIDAVFDAFEGQLWRSYAVARADKLGAAEHAHQLVAS